MSKHLQRLAVDILTILAATYGGPATNSSTVCGPEQEDRPREAPWKVRLYDANRDRRAARKKRAKKIRGRR